MTYDFAHLLAPTSFDEFISAYYEKKPLLVARGLPRYYDDLITLEGISEHLGSADIRYPGIRLVRSGDEVNPTEYTYSVPTHPTATTDGIANKEKVFARFYQGYTIILTSHERHSQGIFRLRHIAERAFHARVQSNIYITPRHSQGFNPHWDNHDVFILQFEGTKEWTVYDCRTPPPNKTQLFDGAWTRVEPTMKATLQPGDLLYLPKGFVHEARSGETVSGHVTLGITAYTYADLLRLVLNGIDDAPGLRDSLPLGFDRAGEHECPLLRYATNYLSGIDLPAAIRRLHDEYSGTRLSDASHRLMDYVRIASVDETTRFQRKPSVFFDIEYGPMHVVLRFSNKAVKFPITAGECIRSILASETFRVNSLLGNVDSSSKLVIVRKLVEEGFLTVLP